MIRQAHTYLAGAVSGTALVGAAIVAFVLLVSLQALRDWPLAGIGDFGDSGSVSSGHPAGRGSAVTEARAVAPGANVAGGAARRHGGISVPGRSSSKAGIDTAPAPVTADEPAAQAPAPTQTGSGSAPSPAPPAAKSASGSVGGGDSSGGAGSASQPGTGSGSTSGVVSGAVNETVEGVDEAAGGALGETGVTKVTEEVVNGVAGPESPVGKTVDKVVETVGGLLGPHH